MIGKFSRALVAQLLGIVTIGACLVWASHLFPVVEFITRAQHKIGEMEWMGAILYPLLLATCNLLLLPGGVIAIGSGLFFGLWWGFLLVWIGTMIGAAAAFWMARWFGRNWVESRMTGDNRWTRLDEAIDRRGPRIIFLTQVHPLFPTSLLNYFYGITRISFWRCMLWVGLGQAPGLFLYCYLGTLTQHGIRLMHRTAPPKAIEYAEWFGGLIVTLAVTTALARVAISLLREIQAGKNAEPEADAPDPSGESESTEKKNRIPVRNP